MFFSKDIDAKINKWADKGMIGKLARAAYEEPDEKTRAKAYAAMGKIRDESSVEAIFMCFKLRETKLVRLSAAKALGMIATKKEFDAIQHIINIETDEEVKEVLTASSIEAKDRAARW